MNFNLVLVIILLISFLWALRDARTEMSVLKNLNKIKIKKKRKIAGVILFLRKKIIHYTSESS